jgi:hypothetical protein
VQQSALYCRFRSNRISNATFDRRWMGGKPNGRQQALNSDKQTLKRAGRLADVLLPVLRGERGLKGNRDQLELGPPERVVNASQRWSAK